MRRSGWMRRVAAIGATGGLLAGGIEAAPAVAGDPRVPVPECPGLEIMPVDDLQRGMTGFGLTVTEGHDPETFGIEVLGVLRDALLPGRDLVIVETSGPIIDRVGGIWFGMSGSPVYVDGKLVGAVAFGFSFGPSPLAGVTAAEDMAELLREPDDASAAWDPGRVVRLPRHLQRTAMRRTGMTEQQAEQGLVQLKIPFSMSGVSGRGIRRIGEMMERAELPFVPYVGAGAPAAPTLASEPLEAGDSIAATLSYGDVTSAGIGTTTFVCPDVAVGFGHPFFWSGPLPFGANHAEAITIWPDPVFGAFKLATVEDLVGVMDRDRFAGIRADLGGMPTLIPMTSSTVATNTGRSRDGETTVVDTEFVPFLAFSHLFSNIDSAFDQISGGGSSMAWTITGTRENGEPWELVRQNVYASPFDISFETGFELLGQLSALLANPFEAIAFTSVDMDPVVGDAVSQYRLRQVTVSVNGGPFLERRRIKVERGDRLVVQALLVDRAEERGEADEETTVDFAVRVPRLRHLGFLEISGANRSGPGIECIFFPEECVGAEGIGSFDELLQFFQEAPTNDKLLGTLDSGRRFIDLGTHTFDRVTRGFKRIKLIPKG